MVDSKIAVIGTSGVVGRALMEQLGQDGRNVIGVSRRPPADLPGASFYPLDLQNIDACRKAARSELADVTHLIYAALYEKPGLIAGWREAEQMQTNLSMLHNLLKPLSIGSRLQHVTLLQGTKAYGAHIAPMKIPGVESDPRHPHENFYWLQQDYLADLCDQVGWHYTIWRPQIVFGHALHAPMNMLAAIGVYATLQKAAGLPFAYPGGVSGVTEAVDADLLASAISFSLYNPGFDNEVFNITNGDVFRWQDIWPAIADCFALDTGEPSPQLLSQSLYGEETAWQSVVAGHGLRPYTIRELVGDSFYYADALFNTGRDQPPPPALLSTIKLRQAGFDECIDTVEMFQKWFDKLRTLKVLPP
jgi:nucleoside-diphosphate-sugar epimerase